MIDALQVSPPNSTAVKPIGEETCTKSKSGTENMKDDPFTTSFARDRSNLSYNNHPSFFNRLNEGAGGGVSNVPEFEISPIQSSASTGNDVTRGGHHAQAKHPAVVKKPRVAPSTMNTRKLTSRSTRDINSDVKRAASSTAETAQPQRRSMRLNTFRGKISSGDREPQTGIPERERERDREARKTKQTGARSRAMNGKPVQECEKDSLASEDVNVCGNPRSLDFP